MRASGVEGVTPRGRGLSNPPLSVCRLPGGGALCWAGLRERIFMLCYVTSRPTMCDPLPLAGVWPSLPPAVREAVSFEQSAAALAEHVFEPLGFEVRRLARVPYLSHGGPNGGLAELDDALFVLTL